MAGDVVRGASTVNGFEARSGEDKNSPGIAKHRLCRPPHSPATL